MNFANPHIQTLGIYKPPLEGRSDYQGLLLDFNERTIPASPKVQAALQAYVEGNRFQIYPEYGDIAKKIASYAEVKPSQVLITNGSDQGIDLIFRTFSQKGDCVVIPEPSFAMFYQSAGAVGNVVISPSYQWPEMSYPIDGVLGAIKKSPKVIVICNPNNPTGTLATLDQIEQIAKAFNEALILVDEAYYEFSQLTAVPLLDQYPNIVITRTFSKAFGLVALRIGYVLAREEIINELLKVRGPYDVNRLSVVAVQAALDDVDDVRNYAEEVMTKAKPMVEQWLDEQKIPFVPSSSNFILLKPREPEVIFEQLLERGIRIRPRSGGMIRVTIGTVEQMKIFIQTYKTLLQ